MFLDSELSKAGITVASLTFLSGIIIGALLLYPLTKELSSDKDALKQNVIDLKNRVSDQRNTITAYQKALIGEGQDLLSMYDSVQQAAQIDIIVHGDTESGLPVKFILDCGGDKK